MARVLVVDDKEIMRGSLQETLCRSGHSVECFGSAQEALVAFENDDFEAVVTDLKMPGMTGIDFVKEIRRVGEEVPVIVITAYGTIETAVEAIKCGAFDYVKKPFSSDQIEDVVGRAVAQRRLLAGNGRPGAGLRRTRDIIGASTVMRGLKEQIGRLAHRNSLVLIEGETGTGKELVARALHYEGPRRAHPLVCVNCPGLSSGVLESELFGHEKGAFTGADRDRVGRFELATHGTILLDEVSEIDAGLQAKLLRVLQERTYERVGSSDTRTTDARIIATTNRDLEEQVKCHRLRPDLYFRLNVIPVRIPPLRERKEDIPLLAEEFLRRYATRGTSLSQDALGKLNEYDWPGNVRELENVIERACVFSDAPVLGPDKIVIQRRGKNALSVGRLRRIEEIEREAIEVALEYFAGHQERAAASLGITSRTLRNKIRRYELDN